MKRKAKVHKLSLSEKFTSLIHFDSQGYNECYIGKRDERTCIIKFYKSQNRFRTEIKFHKIFRENGFSCPEIIGYQKGKDSYVAFEYVEGTPCFPHVEDQLFRCVKQVANVVNSLTKLVVCSEKIKKPKHLEIGKILEAISSISCSSQKISEIESLLGNYFIWGLFKDSKPANWIFAPDGRLFLIDFDYIRIGHAFSDLAQLLSYAIVANFSLSIDVFINCFIHHSNISIPLGIGKKLAYIFILYSNIKKNKYIFDVKMKSKFEKLNVYILEKIF